MTGIEDLSGLRSSTRYKGQRVIGFLDRTKLPLTGIGVSDIIGIVYTTMSSTLLQSTTSRA